MEIKSALKFPQELLILFSVDGKPATLQKVSCIHMFETCPQSKCAVSYTLRLANAEEVNLVIVFSVTVN